MACIQLAKKSHFRPPASFIRRVLMSLPPPSQIIERGYVFKDEGRQSLTASPLGESLVAAYSEMNMEGIWKCVWQFFCGGVLLAEWRRTAR